MWTLVFINLIFNAQSQQVEPVIEAHYEYTSMTECFLAREILLKELTNDPLVLYYPFNTQAVCIQQSE